MSKPRRKYGSPEAVTSALKSVFEAIWREYVEEPGPPKTVYHYCRENVLWQILRAGKLWASDVLCMNDPKEITYAFTDIISPLVDIREDGSPRYFIKSIKNDLVKEVWGKWCTHIACLSSTAELPSQWARYAECTGYAIGFDRSRLEQWCHEQQISLFPMSYDRPRHKEMIRRFLDREVTIEVQRNLSTPSAAREALRGKAVTYLSSLAMTIKENVWRGEREWRILVIQPEGENRFKPLTRRNERNDVVSYFELSICTPQLVTEVVLGPRCCADLGELRRELNNAGFDSVRLRRCLCDCPGPNSESGELAGPVCEK
jgi:hypothetical protein